MMPRASLLLLLAFPPLQVAAQSPVAPADYGRFESLGDASLSPDGRWMAYAVSRVNERNELRIRPMDRDTAFVVPNGSGPAFSPDSRWAAYLVGVAPAVRERLEQEKKPVRTALGIRDLATGRTDSIAEVAAFRFSADGRYLAVHRFAAEARRAGDLIVLHLASGSRMSFGRVAEYAWTDRRPVLALAIDTEDGAGNAVQVYDATTQVVRALDSSPARYRGLAWRRNSEDLAVLRTLADSGYADTAHVALSWTSAASANPGRRILDPLRVPGFPGGMRVVESRRPVWSADGTTLFLGLRPRMTATPSAPGTAKESDVQVWHSRDERIIPMQRAQESSDLQRALVAAWHLRDGRVVQVSHSIAETTTILEGGRFATETDGTPYAAGARFGRSFKDIWAVNVRTGQRRKAVERVRSFAGASPSGRKIAWFDGKDWWSQDVETGLSVNLSAAAGADFTAADWDYPDMAPPAGHAGWTADERSFVAYDPHDIWLLGADGKTPPRRLTAGAAEAIVHRLVRLGRASDPIDLVRPVYISLFGRLTKKSGYARLTSGRMLERLVYDDARLARLMRADSADVLAFTREKFNDAPDWHVGGPLLRDPRNVTATNDFQAGFSWGRSEVVDFTSTTGKALQAALYYPANYDPSRKYPMIVRTYERLSDNVHAYQVPSERSYYNWSVWTANGYFVLQPDIVFRAREPGPSVLEAVEPAVKSIIARGIVDSARVGLIGHSWGGYEAAYLPTRTTLFAAAVAGAPITNFLSFPGAVHWTPGVPEMDHWETGQARMDVPYWEDMEAHLRSSPVAKIADLRTPVLLATGDADGTVDWRQSVEFYNYARRAGREDVVLLVYPGEDHGLRKAENQVDYHRRILQWFGHYLKGEPAPPWITEGVAWLSRKATPR